MESVPQEPYAQYLCDRVPYSANRDLQSFVCVCHSSPWVQEGGAFQRYRQSDREMDRTKVDLKKAKEILGGKVCVAGNVVPTGVFLSGTPKEVINEARPCVDAWGKG